MDLSNSPTYVYTLVTNQDGSVYATTNRSAIEVPTFPTDLQARIRIDTDGATAEGGVFTLNVDDSILEPIDILSPNGQRLKLRVSALGASDPQSGKRVWLAVLREDCLGAVLAGEPIRIACTNAFVGDHSNVGFQYNIGSIVNDVLLREPISFPASSGLNPATARLELWSEVFEAPEPRKTPRTISLRSPNAPSRAGPTRMPRMLSWVGPPLKMIPGKAFRVNLNDTGEKENWPVARFWYTNSNKRYIIESVDYQDS